MPEPAGARLARHCWTQLAVVHDERSSSRADQVGLVRVLPRHSGTRDGSYLHGAIFAYNHAKWYVRKVSPKRSSTTVALPSLELCGAGSDTIASLQLGLPYV